MQKFVEKIKEEEKEMIHGISSLITSMDTFTGKFNQDKVMKIERDPVSRLNNQKKNDEEFFVGIDEKAEKHVSK